MTHLISYIGNGELLLYGDAGKIIILVFLPVDTIAGNHLFAYFSQAGLNGIYPAGKHVTCGLTLAQTYGRRVAEDLLNHCFFGLVCAVYRDQHTGTAFFHSDRNGKGIQRAAGEKAVQREPDLLGSHIIHIE